ncbi:MAG: ABC transporter substrate-binding protein [Mariprofundaceae bacterium]|nr:ABC transporter substrate-binding protein [Mariprofundaceae bacterium]
MTIKYSIMALCATLWFAFSPVAMADDGPKAVVESTVNGIIDVLKARQDPKALSEDDRAAISNAVADKFDYRKMARGSIGRSWRDLSESDKIAFSAAFRELLERSYGNRLDSYSDQTIRYADTQFKKKKALVKSWVVDGNKEIPVFYRLYQSTMGWRVFDIKIEGVSLVGTYRKQFKSALKKNGFKVLLGDIKAKVQKMKDKDAA